MNTKKKYLMDVVAIRLSLIFLLVIYHALCIFTRAWDSPFISDINIPIYDWLGTLIHLSQLEAMVFISGLLLGYNALKKTEALSFNSCVVKKIKRILFPCFVFGVIYYVMFYDLQASWYSIVWKILNGCGHLWFLPMIFWCFVLVYLIAITPPTSWWQISDNKKYKVILVAAICFSVVNPFMFVSLGFGRAFDFFIYFFMGYCIQTRRLVLPAVTRKNFFISVIMFVLSFVLYMVLRNHIQVGSSFFEKLSIMILKNICHTTNALSAIYLIYSFANREPVLRSLNNKSILITLSGYCYGVYIYQQFILKILYYNTQLPLVINAYWLPWIATVITIVLSLLLCHFSLKTRLGRFLIG